MIAGTIYHMYQHFDRGHPTPVPKGVKNVPIAISKSSEAFSLKGPIIMT